MKIDKRTYQGSVDPRFRIYGISRIESMAEVTSLRLVYGAPQIILFFAGEAISLIELTIEM